MEPSVSTTPATTTSTPNQTLRIIRTFLEHAYSHQFDLALNDEFERLKQLTNEIRIFRTKTTNEGEKESNRKKNRYRDIVPYDDTRVILNSTSSDDDYINASFVRGALDDHYKYIAAQGPSKETIVDFIRMLVQFNTKIVICACNEYEGQKLKCFRYWTDNENLQVAKNYYISLKSKPVVFDGLIVRELVVRSLKSAASNSSSSNDPLKDYEFTQFHITNWPDHGVPNRLDSIMTTLKIVRHKLLDQNNSRLNSEFLAVHCSAGCGRTGTIIAIDQVWTLLKQNKLGDDFSLYKIAYALREQRIAMIQTVSQYQLFAKAVVDLFESELAKLNRINNHNNTNITNANNSKPFPVRTTNSNYDNLSNLAYQKTNQASVIRSVSPSDFKQDNDDLFLKTTHASPNPRRLNNVDSNNNNISSANTSKEFNAYSSDKQFVAPKSPNTISRSTSKSSETTSSKSKSSRFTPNLFNIFSPSQSKSEKPSKSSNFPLLMSGTPSASPAPMPDGKLSNSVNYENIMVKKPDDTLSPTSNVSSIYLSLNPKSSLTRSLLANQSNNNKSYLTSKSIQIDSNLNSSNTNYLNLKQITNDNNNSDSATSSTISTSTTTTTNGLASPSQNLPGNKQQQQQSMLHSSKTSPQLTRKFYNDSNPTSGDNILNMSYTESNPNESLNAGSRNPSGYQQNELYLNDVSLNKKEPGSVCEFLSNKLEINRQNSTKSTLEHNALAANNLASVSTMSDSNITPAAYAVKSTKNFVLTANQAKIGSVKHTDLRQMNPPMKAELYDSLPKVSLDTSIQLDDLDQVPKPPVRRTKKTSKAIDDDDKNELRQIEAKKTANFSIKYDKNPYANNNNKTSETTATNNNNTTTTTANTNKIYTTQLSVQQPNETGVVFRSSRSNSSTYYDNHNESDDHSTSVRNAVIIESNLQKAKQTQQRVSKNSQKNSDSSISQTLPSRKSMTSLNNNYDQMNLNDQLVANKKKEIINSTNHSNYSNSGNSSSSANNTNHHHQRTNHFSHHFNFPYRIQFAKTNSSENAKSSSSAADDGKYFLYNNRIKNDFIRNSENLSELNQMKRRSAHLFNL